MDNRRRYLNVIKNLNLQDEHLVNEALKNKGFYSKDATYPLSSLHFELTSKCNSFCKHCYNNSGNYNNDDNMTVERWIEFSKYIVNKGGVFECLISGGEPLLFGDSLFDIMDILHNDGTIFLLMTNGQLLTEEIARKLKKYHYHWLQISIDGVNKEYHDWFRQVNGCWEKAIKGAKAVSNNGIPLKIAHCVTSYNLNQVDEMCDLAYSLGASSIILGKISLSGRTATNRNLLLSKHEIDFLDEKIKYNSLKYKNKMKIKSTNSVKQGLINHSKRPRSSAVITPNGDIRIDGMAPFIIGNILNNDFTQIWEQKIDQCWENPKVKEFIEQFDKNDRNEIYINYIEKDILL